MQKFHFFHHCCLVTSTCASPDSTQWTQGWTKHWRDGSFLSKATRWHETHRCATRSNKSANSRTLTASISPVLWGQIRVFGRSCSHTGPLCGCMWCIKPLWVVSHRSTATQTARRVSSDASNCLSHTSHSAFSVFNWRLADRWRNIAVSVCLTHASVFCLHWRQLILAKRKSPFKNKSPDRYSQTQNKTSPYQ